MPDLPLTIEKIAGNASDETEVGILTKKVSLADGSGGTLVCCTLANGQKDAIAAVIRDIFDLATNRIEAIEGEVLENLNSIAQAAQDYVSGKEISLSFILGFFYSDVGYIVRVGERVRAFVFEGERSGELSFESGSGPIGPGQIYLIATEGFLENFDKEILKTPDLDLLEVIDGLATEVSSRENQSEMGAVFVTVGDLKEEEQEKEGKENLLETEQADNGDSVSEENAEEVGVDAGEQGATLETEIILDEVGGDRGKETEEIGLSEVDVELTPNEEVVREEETAFVSEVDQTKRGVPLVGKVKNALWGGFFKVGREAKRLKRGDIRAMMRLRRNILLVAVVVILILAASGGWAIYSKTQKTKTLEFQKHLDIATAKFNEGSSIIELNRLRAREILAEAQKEVDLAKAVGIKSPQADNLASEIASKIKQTDISSGAALSEFAQVSEYANSLTIWNKNFVVFGRNKIFVLGPDGETSSEIKGEDMVRGVVFDNKAFVISGSGVTRVDLASESSKQVVDDASGQDIGVFVGNIYLLGKSQIAKIVPIEGGYSTSKDYLTSPAVFEEESRFAIDSLVWTTNGKEILKFNRGKRESFEISGLSGEVGKLGPIYTDSNIDNLYVIDKANSTLLVIDKSGSYKKSLQSPDFAQAVDLVVSPSEDKVFVAVESRVLEANLQ